MRQILCAMDYREASMSVLRVAFSLASCYAGHLTILFSYRLISHESGKVLPGLKMKLEEEARKEFEDLEQRVTVPRPASYHFQNEIGFLSDRVEAFARTTPLFLIVAGTSFVDSVATQKGIDFSEFSRKTGAPIVLVPEGRELEGFD